MNSSTNPPISTQLPQYQRCMVMAGGGFRFGIYLGMYAAARDAGKTPDLLLASCGAAIAAALIQALPDDEQRKAWLSSHEMYQFWASLQSTSQAAIHRSLIQAIKRKLSSKNTPKIPDVFQDYMFEIPPNLPLPTVSPSQAAGAPAVAIIGGKLLYQPEEVGQPRGHRKLFEETVFCDQRTATLLQGIQSPFSAPMWGNHAIAPQLLIDVDMPLAEAVRISVSDMFYFRCHSYRRPATGQMEHYIGGVLDLFPIEIARRLAHEVTMEFKESFDQTFAIPALRAVLGINGNQRLRYVHHQFADTWIDSSDISIALAREQVQKKLAFRRNRVSLIMPDSYDTYVQYIEAQWQYGYQRAKEAFAKTSANSKEPIRNANRYNSPQGV
ncbi:hypothetical protein AAKU64_004060 [Undibacterium sp. GrIS 1.8]|uniref:hypothetical protein n=1 Tax=unclassified Undibacterium TaxID=2630295 RepID=UPI003391B94D